MVHKKNTRTGKPLPHDPKEKKKILLEEKRLRDQASKSEKTSPKKDTQEGVFKQETTGRPSGVSIGGRTFLGLSPEEVAKVQQQQGVQAGVGGQGGLLPFGDPAQNLLEEQKQQEFLRGRKIPLEAFEGTEAPREGTPEIVNALLKSPFGQASISREALSQVDLKQLKEMTDRMIESGLTPEEVTNEPFLQSLLKLELNDIDLKVLESGEVQVKAFTQFIEGIPGIGSFARKYTGEMIPTASRRSDNILAEITDIESSTTKWREATSRNPQQIPRVKRMTQEALDRLLWLESVNKLLIIQSPILQANPEEVNTIISKIDSVKVNLQNRIQELEFKERFQNTQ